MKQPLLSEPVSQNDQAKAALRLRLPRKISPRLSFFVLTLALFCGASAPAAAPAPLEDGAKIPDLTLTTSTGEKVTLSRYARGRKKRNLLLVFFRTGTCNVCVHQLMELAQEAKQIEEGNTAVLALSTDDAIIHTLTREKIEKRFPLLLDPDAKAVKAFGVFNPEEKLSRPAIYLVGPDSKVLYHYVGKNMSDRPKTSTVLEAVQHYSGLTPRKAASQK